MYPWAAPESGHRTFDEKRLVNTLFAIVVHVTTISMPCIDTSVRIIRIVEKHGYTVDI